MWTMPHRYHRCSSRSPSPLHHSPATVPTTRVTFTRPSLRAIPMLQSSCPRDPRRSRARPPRQIRRNAMVIFGLPPSGDVSAGRRYPATTSAHGLKPPSGGSSRGLATGWGLTPMAGSKPKSPLPFMCSTACLASDARTPSASREYKQAGILASYGDVHAPLPTARYICAAARPTWQNRSIYESLGGWLAGHQVRGAVMQKTPWAAERLIDRPVGAEARKTFNSKLVDGFVDRYLCGAHILDIGYKGYVADAVPIMPQALGIDLDYPGYDGRSLPFADNSQDAVYSSHCLEHIADYRQ